MKPFNKLSKSQQNLFDVMTKATTTIMSTKMGVKFSSIIRRFLTSLLLLVISTLAVQLFYVTQFLILLLY